jgi:hypothetical protein
MRIKSLAFAMGLGRRERKMEAVCVTRFPPVPLIPKRESGSGTLFNVKLTVNLITMEIASPTRQPSEKNPE